MVKQIDILGRVRIFLVKLKFTILVTQVLGVRSVIYGGFSSTSRHLMRFAQLIYILALHRQEAKSPKRVLMQRLL